MRTRIAMAALFVSMQLPGAAVASSGNRCSLSMLAGRWLFATALGHQALGKAAPAGDLTAIGTMNIRRNGDVEGTFDVTFEGASFVGDVGYSGKLTVNPDCTGTLTFTTVAGTTRVDSLAILNRREFWGMSRDPKNLWTYQARRIGN